MRHDSPLGSFPRGPYDGLGGHRSHVVAREAGGYPAVVGEIWGVEVPTPRTFRHCLAVALTIRATTVLVSAQPATSTIEGVVRDRADARLAGALVTAADHGRRIERTVATSMDGRFVLLGLPIEGVYEVRAELPGFRTSARQGVITTEGQPVVIDFVLDVATSETVTVVSTPALLLDRGRSTLQQVVPETLLRALPVVGPDFFPLVSLAPGFTGNPDYPNPQGQLYSAHNILVDTGSHFSKWRSTARGFNFGYSLESLQQLQVRTGLASAEFGDALASVTSVTTLAGSDAWRGSALVFLRDAALDAPPAFSTQKPPGDSQRYGLSIGGPLGGDATRVFGSFEGDRTRNHNIVTSPAAADAMVPDTRDEHLMFFRVDRVGSREHLAVRYNGQRFRWHQEPGGLTLPGSGTSYQTDTQTVLVTHALQLSPTLTNELRGQFARYVDIRRDLQPSVYVSRAGYSIEGGRLGPVGFGAQPEDTWEAADTLGAWLGPHSLRAGGGIRYVRAHNMAQTYGYGAYFFAGAPAAYPEPFSFTQAFALSPGAPDADPRSTSAFGFVQDDVKLGGDLTVNLGLRYDIERVFNVGGYDPRTDANNLQPRLGAAWDVGGGGRTVVRGGIGIFTQQQLLYPINRVELEGVDGVATMTVSAESPLMPMFPDRPSAPPPVLPPRDLYLASSSLSSPFSMQAAVGMQQAVFGNRLSIDLVRLDGHDLLSLVDANAPESNQKPNQRTVAEADRTRPITPAPGGYRKLITLGNEGRSWYRALQVSLARPAGPLQALGSYTLSQADDMANYELPEDSRNVDGERARASADVRHNMSAGATWRVPGSSPLTRGWSVASLVTLRSGRPYTIAWGDDRNGTTQSDARPDGRNTARTGPYRTVDLSVTRTFHRSAWTIEARVDAFNLLNATNYDQYVGVLLSPLYSQPVSAFPQRRLQLGIVTRF